MRLLILCQQLDTRVLLWSVRHRERRALPRGARWASRTGDGYVQVAVPCGLWFGGGDARALALQFAWLFGLERALYWVAKNGLRRRRPPDCVPSFTSMIVASDRFSFPSGHTSAAFLFAALVQAQVPAQMPALGVAVFGWACAVGASRVALGVHFPSDILAGAALGLAIAELQPLL